MRRPAVPHRHAGDGLSNTVMTVRPAARRDRSGARRAGARPARSKNMATHPLGSRKIETSNFLMIVLILLTGRRRRLVEIVPLFFQRPPPQPVPGVQALHRAAAGRARHLHPRGLLQLPLADGPPVPRRDAALRPLLGGRRVRLRPPRSSGAASAPAGPGARRRRFTATMAPHPPEQPARRGARVEHAAYPGWKASTVGRRHGAAHEGAAHGRRALHRRRDRQGGPPKGEGQDRAGRADRLPAGAGHRASSEEAQWT